MLVPRRLHRNPCTNRKDEKFSQVLVFERE
jgi:hypothetical protein